MSSHVADGGGERLLAHGEDVCHSRPNRDPRTFAEAIDCVRLQAPALPAMRVATCAASSSRRRPSRVDVGEQPVAVDVGGGGSSSSSSSGKPTEICYGKLADLSMRVAAALVELSAKPRSDRPIGTCMRRGPDWYVVYVAAARLGIPLAALSVDLATDKDAERIHNRTIIEELRPQLIVVDGSAEDARRWVAHEAALLTGSAEDVLPTVIPWLRLVSHEPSTSVTCQVEPDDLLCYAFTGGTTSRRKCVRITHRMAAYEIVTYPDALGAQCAEPPRVLQPSSFYWAAAVYGQLDLVVAFRGCAVVTEAFDTWEIAAVVRAERIGIVGLPPSSLGLLAPQDLRTDCLRCIISWGEACPPAVAERWGNGCHPWVFRDLLISTEYWLALASSARSEDGRSLFRAMPGTTVLVRRLQSDADGPHGSALLEAADGEVGELCIGGPTVCAGVREIGKTAQQESSSFVYTSAGDRMYCSGDLVVKRGNLISFAGREDEFVKVYGRWLDLGSIARQIQSIDGIEEASAISIGPSQYCVAVVVAPGLDSISRCTAAAAVLPKGGNISVHALDRIPRSAATQKVNRQMLRSMLADVAFAETTAMSSASRERGVRRANESRSLGQHGQSVLDVFCNVIAEALEIEAADPDASFLQLGGNSMVAVKATAAMSACGLRLNAVVLLAGGSLRNIASEHVAQPTLHPEGQREEASRSSGMRLAGSFVRRVLGRLQSRGSDTLPSVPEFVPQPLAQQVFAAAAADLHAPQHAIQSLSPCTPFQESMLMAIEAGTTNSQAAKCLTSMPAGPKTANVGLLQSCAILGPAVDLIRFQQSWEEVCRAHAAFSAAFIRAQGRYWQIALKPQSVDREPWLQKSVSGDFDVALRGFLDEDAARGFDMRRPGLYRGALLKLPDGRHAFVFTVHNLICDAWSYSNLVNDALQHYCNCSRIPQRPPLSDIAAQLAARDTDSYATFWRDTFADFSSPAIDRELCQHRVCEDGEPRELRIQWASLSECAAAMSTMPAVLIHAAWALVWAWFTEVQDVAIGSVLSGREFIGESAVGVALSLVPLRLRLAGETLEKVVSLVHTQLVSTIQHQHCTIAEVRDWASLPSEQALFTTVLIFENAPELPQSLLRQAEFKPHVEREVSMTNTGTVPILELRVVKTPSGALSASFSGAPCRSAEACGGTVGLMNMFNAVLQHFTSWRPNMGSVDQMLTTMPVMPWAAGRSLSEMTQLCKRLDEHLRPTEAIDLPLDAVRAQTSGNSTHPPFSRNLEYVPWSVVVGHTFAAHSDDESVALAAWATLLCHASGASREQSHAMGVLVGSGAEAHPRWFPLPLGGAVAQTPGADVNLPLVAAALHERLTGLVTAASGSCVPSRRALEQALRRHQSPSCLRALFAGMPAAWIRLGATFVPDALDEADAASAWAIAAAEEPAAEVSIWLLGPDHLANAPGGRRTLRGILGYDAGSLDRSSALRMARRLEAIIREGSMASALAPERTQMLHNHGVGASQPLPEVSIAVLVSQQARRTPWSTAVKGHDARLSYRDLDSACSKVAAQFMEILRQAGSVGSQGPAIGVLAERSAAMVVAMLATLRVGAAYVPLSPTAPVARVEHMITLAHVALVATEQWLAERAESLSVPAVVLRLPALLRTSVPHEKPRGAAAKASTPMYVLFTSGSTGQPKMVRASGQPALTHLLHIIGAYRFTAGDIQLQHTSPTWVAAMPEIWAPFLVGASLAVARGGSADALKDLEALASMPRAASVSLLQFVPSVLSALMLAGFDPVGPACRHLVLTGEPLPIDLCRRLKSCRKPMLRNHYGQTEAADTTTYYELDLSDAESVFPRSAVVPIGIPASHRHVWLGSPSCSSNCGEGGAPGEMLVAGPGLLLVDASSSTATNARGAGEALLTGDLGRWSGPNGDVLVCLGRRDRQVKVRGHRIELAEVEAALRRAAAETQEVAGGGDKALETAVMLDTDGNSQRLVAYILPAEASAGSAGASLIAACRAWLPSYMVPDVLVGVSEWPRLSTGKLDRQSLPKPPAPSAGAGAQIEASAASAAAAVATATEALCCAPEATISWRRLLGKALQVARPLFAGACCARLQAWRALSLPHVWLAFAEALSSRGGSMRGFRQELSEQTPWLLFFLVSGLLPRQAYLLAAVAGACCAARGEPRAFPHGARRILSLPVLWWLGLSSTDSTLRDEVAWYAWYLRPQGLQALLRSTHSPRSLLASLRLAVAARLGNREACVSNRGPDTWDWDRWYRKPKSRPRLERVHVHEEVVASDAVPSGSGAAVMLRKDDLSGLAKQLLDVAEAEAGRGLEMAMPLSSIFDSLRLMGFVVAAREATGIELTLRDALKCDTLGDLLCLPVVQAPDESSGSSAGAANSRSDESHMFRVPEFRYMFSIAVCWALVADEQIDIPALKRALHDMATRHEALRAELADPPQLMELAMEAAANLSLMREALSRWMSQHCGQETLTARACRVLNSAVANAIHCAWPRICTKQPQAVEVPLDVVECDNTWQLEQRSAWLLDGRSARQFLRTPMHAVLLCCSNKHGHGADEAARPRLHIVVSHGVSDGFSGLPLLTDLQERYTAYFRGGDGVDEDSDDDGVLASVGVRKRVRGDASADETSSSAKRSRVVATAPPSSAGKKRKAQTDGELPASSRACARQAPPSSFAEQQQRLENALFNTHSASQQTDAAQACSADLSSWALPIGTEEAFEHYVWIQERSILTLERIIERRRWCCSLDVALLAVLSCALVRARPIDGERVSKPLGVAAGSRSGSSDGVEVLRLRLAVAARDGQDQGLMVSDFSDYRDLDVELPRGAGIDEIARSIALLVRHRRWRVPSAFSVASDRVFMNFRPLLDQKDWTGALKHQTKWPPVHGERNWDKRHIPFALWIMADQVEKHEWVLCMKVQHARPWEAKLGKVVESVLRDLALDPSAPLRKAAELAQTAERHNLGQDSVGCTLSVQAGVVGSS